MAAPPMKSPLHDFPSTFLKWKTKKDRRSCPPPPSSPSPPPPSSLPPPSLPVGSRSTLTRRPATPLRPEPEPEQTPEEVEKQWNLRPRRRACAAAEGATTVVDAVDKSVVSCGGDREKRKFWIALSKDEIEQDFYSMTGSKPSRRPRKHPKIFQKYVDNVSPGLCLVGFTPDTYRNFDPPHKK